MQDISVFLTLFLSLLTPLSAISIERRPHLVAPPQRREGDPPCFDWFSTEECQEERPAYSYPEPATCEVTWNLLWCEFNISGSYSYWDHWKLGADNAGKGLLDNLHSCGTVSGWAFIDLAGNETWWDWQATGNLPFTIQECIPEAMKAAGAPATPWICRHHWIGWDPVSPDGG